MTYRPADFWIGLAAFVVLTLAFFGLVAGIACLTARTCT